MYTYQQERKASDTNEINYTINFTANTAISRKSSFKYNPHNSRATK